MAKKKSKESAAKNITGGGTPATVALTEAGVEFRLRPYEHGESTHYGEEAAAALGVEPTMIFKTLVADVSGELVTAVVPVACQLDLKALAGAVGGKKAQLTDPALAARSSGYVVGGISPIGQRTTLRTVIDESALTLETMLVSAGKRGLQVELAPADLVRVTQAVTAPIGP